MRYEIRRNGIWENKTAAFKVAKLLLFFDLVIGVKGLICRCAAKARKRPNGIRPRGLFTVEAQTMVEDVSQL